MKSEDLFEQDAAAFFASFRHALHEAQAFSSYVSSDEEGYYAFIEESIGLSIVDDDGFMLHVSRNRLNGLLTMIERCLKRESAPEAERETRARREAVKAKRESDLDREEKP